MNCLSINCCSSRWRQKWCMYHVHYDEATSHPMQDCGSSMCFLQCNGGISYELCMVFHAKCQSQHLTSSLPSARSSAVSSSMFRSIVSAPDWQRRLAMAASCLPTARWRGVQPLNMAASTLAPLLRSSFTDVMSCSSTAR